MGKVLVFNVNIMKVASIAGLCQKLGHSLQVIPVADYANTIGALAGLPGHRMSGKSNAKQLPDEMLVMVGLESDELDRFLAAYREAKIPPIRRKAVLTPTNSSWSVAELYEDLDEHANM